jgi:hypothetical protein
MFDSPKEIILLTVQQRRNFLFRYDQTPHATPTPLPFLFHCPDAPLPVIPILFKFVVTYQILL